MSRRSIFIILLIVLAVLATTVAPWTLSGNGFAASVAEQLRDGYGIDLTYAGAARSRSFPCRG